MTSILSLSDISERLRRRTAQIHRWKVTSDLTLVSKTQNLEVAKAKHGEQEAELADFEVKDHEAALAEEHAREVVRRVMVSIFHSLGLQGYSWILTSDFSFFFLG